MGSMLPITNPGESRCSLGCSGCGQAGSLEKTNQPPAAVRRNAEEALLRPEAQVLPTLQRDGERRWLSPSLSPGYFWTRRRWVAYGLIAFFVALPHFRIGGKPPVLLDIVHREFTFLGHTFYPTDSLLLALLMLTAFFSVMLVTALAGRVWCGWGCPQTVYLEFVFRPIDRFFQGTVGRGGQPRRPMSWQRQMLRIVVYVVLSMFLAHTFLSYFVGTDSLARWMLSSPFQHPVAFLVMGAATAAMLFDFLFFREQLCMIACPYGRFQSVMLDRRSWIVSYDSRRGEPRGHRRVAEPGIGRDQVPAALSSSASSSAAIGDCVDCGRCLAVCPTGIDIRRGLQLECIHCAQCIDACDAVMHKLHRPSGLIRYSSQAAMDGLAASWLRPRTLIYPTLIAGALTLFGVVLSSKFAFDVQLLPSPGAPFMATGDPSMIQNNRKLSLANRSTAEQTYSLEVLQPAGVEIEWAEKQAPSLLPNQRGTVLIRFRFPSRLTEGSGSRPAVLAVRDQNHVERLIEFYLNGP
jgi:cytochrome c oxidase accessory protein FixG